MRESRLRAWYPLLVLVAFVLVLLIGSWGFAIYERASLVDHFYRSLQLFVLESGNGLVAPLPWQLEFARLAAPALTVTSTAVAVAVLSRNRVDGWRARHRRHHVVVCGLGRHGATAALALRDAGESVVGVDRDPAAGGVRRCRRAGVPIVVGDARDPLVLATAGVRTADHLLVVTPALDFTGQVALAAVDLVADREGTPLTIHLEVDEPELAALLRALKLTEHHAPSWRIEELDLAGAGARAMLDELPPWSAQDPSAHILVAGASPLSAAVVMEAVRRWRHSGRPADALTVTLMDPEPRTWDRFSKRWPPATTRLRGLPAHRDLDPSARPGRLTAAYVCTEDEAHALTTSLAILRELPDVPVLLRLEDAAAFGELVHRDTPALRVISLDASVLTPAVLLDSTTERVARALHDAYRRTAPAGDPSAVPWDRLPEQLRASNRAQAGHVADKVRATHRVLLPDVGDPPDLFSEDEVDQLGRLEHQRWTEERLAAGWKPGPRDSEARTTPYLVPWEELDEAVREIDRQFVRALPGILSDAGLMLRRVGPRE